jgi:hypothetical protein
VHFSARVSRLFPQKTRKPAIYHLFNVYIQYCPANLLDPPGLFLWQGLLMPVVIGFAGIIIRTSYTIITIKVEERMKVFRHVCRIIIVRNNYLINQTIDLLKGGKNDNQSF